MFDENTGYIYPFILNFKNNKINFNDLNLYYHLFLENAFYVIKKSNIISDCNP